jgi:hypothetical protein
VMLKMNALIEGRTSHSRSGCTIGQVLGAEEAAHSIVNSRWAETVVSKLLAGNLMKYMLAGGKAWWASSERGLDCGFLGNYTRLDGLQAPGAHKLVEAARKGTGNRRARCSDQGSHVHIAVMLVVVHSSPLPRCLHSRFPRPVSSVDVCARPVPEALHRSAVERLEHLSRGL